MKLFLDDVIIITMRIGTNMARVYLSQDGTQGDKSSKETKGSDHTSPDDDSLRNSMHVWHADPDASQPTNPVEIAAPANQEDPDIGDISLVDGDECVLDSSDLDYDFYDELDDYLQRKGLQ